MELNDHEKRRMKDKTNMSDRGEAGASLNPEGTGGNKNFRDETLVGVSGQVGGNQRNTERGPSFGTGERHVSEAPNPRVRVTKVRNQSEGSDGDLISSLRSNKKTILGLAGALAGGALLFKAFRKGKPSSKRANVIQLHTKQTIKNPREELYAYWRNLENLPNFMSHIEEVREIDQRRSKWTAKIPGGVGTIDWEAVIEQDLMNKYISWRSVADADIENAGEVRFEDAPGRKGTIVETTISYRPPAGEVGEFAAKLLNPAFEKIVKQDLKQFKKHMEQGGDVRRKRILY